MAHLGSKGPPDMTLLGDVAHVSTTLQGDVLAFNVEAREQVARFRAGSASLEDVCFWYKSFAGAFFSYAEGLCFTLRKAIHENGEPLGLSKKQCRIPYVMPPLQRQCSRWPC